MSASNSQPIDQIRNAAIGGRVGTGNEGAIREMMPLGDTMYFIMQSAIYAMRLADSIDPERKNPSVPNAQQRVLRVGSDHPMVARTLLTAKTLFVKTSLGQAFPVDDALKFVLSILMDLHALAEIHKEVEQPIDSAKADCMSSDKLFRGTLSLPETDRLKARCDAFAQKAGHVVNSLEGLAKLFHPGELTAKWIDQLTRLVTEKYGDTSDFAEWIKKAGPFLLFVNDMRNIIEHPKPNKRIDIHDFTLNAGAEIELPFLVIVRPDRSPEKAPITAVMQQITDDLTSCTEVLIAFLCAYKVQPFGGVPIMVGELPENQRAYKDQRFYYVTNWNGRITRVG